MMADKLSGQAENAPPGDARVLVTRHAAAAEPAWLWDPRRNRVVWGNDAAVKFWDAGSALDLIEYRFLGGSPEAKLAAGLRGGEEREAVLAPNGDMLRAHVRAEAAMLFDGSEGLLVHILETLPPVSDPVAARKAALFEAAPVALLQLDASGGIVEANALGQEFAGTLSQHILVKLARQALARGSANRSLNAMLGGQERALRIFASRLEDTDEPGAILRIDDVTDRRALEAQTLQAPPPAPPAKAAEPPVVSPDAQKRFIANLSHEMRNPLNAILGFSEVMQQRRFGPLGNHRYEGYVDDIRMSASHLLDLVNDLLDMGKLADGQFKTNFEAVTLATVVTDCERMLSAQAGAIGVRMEIAMEPGLPPVVADARAMKQIVLNILSNAVKFTGQGGKVQVTGTLESDGGVVVRVNDSGIGMTEAELARALEPYGQIDSDLQRQHKGTGLGLPLAKALAEANKCEFHIASAPHQGTQITLIFPAARVLAG